MTRSVCGFSVRLYGPFCMMDEGRVIGGLARGSTHDLCLYLLHSIGNTVRRDKLADMFWTGSTQKSRASLSTALWRLNKHIRSTTPLEVMATEEVVWVERTGPVEFDRDRLSASIARVRRSRDPSRRLDPDLREELESALSDCRGEYLEGCEMEWARSEREVAETLRLEACRYLVEDARLGRRTNTAIRWVRAYLKLDPYHEGMHHALLELLVESGQRSRAILHYEELRRRLAGDLGVAPQDETTELRNRLVSQSQLPTTTGPAGQAVRIEALRSD